MKITKNQREKLIKILDSNPEIRYEINEDKTVSAYIKLSDHLDLLLMYDKDIIKYIWLSGKDIFNKKDSGYIPSIFEMLTGYNTWSIKRKFIKLAKPTAKQMIKNKKYTDAEKNLNHALGHKM